MFDYKCKIEYPEENQETHIDTKKNSHIPPRKKFKIKQIPTKFVCSDTVKEALREFKTKRIMQGKTNRNFPNTEIDTIYDKLCNVLITEMEKVIPFFMKPKYSKTY